MMDCKITSPIPYHNFFDENSKAILWGISPINRYSYDDFCNESYEYIHNIDAMSFEIYLWHTVSINYYHLAKGLMHCSFVATSLVYVAGRKCKFFADVWSIVHNAYMQYKNQYIGNWMYFIRNHFSDDGCPSSVRNMGWHIASLLHMWEFNAPLVYQDIVNTNGISLTPDMREFVFRPGDTINKFTHDAHKMYDYFQYVLDNMQHGLNQHSAHEITLFTLPESVMRELQSVPIPEND